MTRLSATLLAAALFVKGAVALPQPPKFPVRRELDKPSFPATSPRNDDLAGVFRRQAVEPGEGALLCPTGRCADGSCCGPNNICGYGPDFCGPGCLGDCDATAMCGVHSAGGNISCGLDLCCSWGGWCGSSEVHCVGPNQWALCQEGFGKCEVIRPATYGENSGSTNGRSIGYYQAWNSRDRACNRVLPDEIQWQNYTHLFFAFASVNPQTFAVVPANPADHQLMLDFTALKRHGVQTWIAVGGFDFSDPGTPTHTTWSDICATPANRAAFISSLAAYMTTYGFQGVDLDWEYPGAPERGGNGHADVTNFVSLLREMRLAYGASFGISLTLAPDYWYLRWFDVAGLEPYVDHMGLMAYDLHGFWDSDVEALGAIVRPQADVSEIYNSSIPLAYAGVNFAKITFGVAWYGRGYTLADPSCNTVGCPFAGPSKPSRCINSAGVMSLDEIKDLIAEKGLTPRLIPGAMMKEISWDDQWIGYDDEETIAMKRGFANNLGFGGIMAWSVDFNSGKSESAPVSTDGTCGSANGARICEGSGFGDCCSGSGWCGSTGAHCGSGCQSGNCTQGAVTTDGRCGAQANNAICAGWPAGDCCSPAGYCGLTEAHCGTGCQNGPCENGPVQPSGTPVQSSGNPGQPTGTPVQSSGNPGQPTGTPIQSSGNTPGQPTGTPLQSSGNTPGQPTGTPVQSNDNTPGQPGGTAGQSNGNTPGHTTGTPVQSNDNTPGHTTGTPVQSNGNTPGQPGGTAGQSNGNTPGHTTGTQVQSNGNTPGQQTDTPGVSSYSMPSPLPPNTTYPPSWN